MDVSRPLARIATAREHFLTLEDVEPDVVRQPILASWVRSRHAGVDATRLDVPYQPEVDLAGRLMACARPVLDRLENELADLPVSIILTDAHARVLDRRVGEGRLHDRLDEIKLAPGFSYAEEHVGTNGIGTALESRDSAFVFASEHFNEVLQPFACAGAPIRNPLTRRLEGIIDLTSFRRDANPIMRALVREAARDIEQALFEHGSASQQAVLREFLAACGRSRHAVLSISGEVVMANTRAATLLMPADQAYLREVGTELLAQPRETELEVCLSGRNRARVRFVPVGVGSIAAGAILEIEVSPARADEQPLGEPILTASGGREPARKLKTGRAAGGSHVPYPGLAGTSDEWIGACREVAEAAMRRAAALLIGEEGVGKVALATAAHRGHFPAAHLTVLECDRLEEYGRDALSAALADGESTVVLRRLDRLTEAGRAMLAGLLDRGADPGPLPWLVGTLVVELRSTESDDILRRFAASVTVPPLRHRIEDLAALVPALLQRLAPGRRVACSPETDRVLRGYRWPGNVGQLERALRAALAKRPVGDIQRQDLPVECFTSSRRTLTPMETAERDLIVKALLDAEGNRVKAAGALGISRATLYRKIETFGIAPVGKH